MRKLSMKGTANGCIRATSLSTLAARTAESRRRRAATSELSRVLASTDAAHRLELETLIDERRAR